jgi:hypothetical protein
MFFLLTLDAASVFSGYQIDFILWRQQIQTVRMIKKITPSTEPKIIGSLFNGPSGTGLALSIFKERHCKIF